MQAIGLDFRPVSPLDTAEPAPLPGEAPVVYALRAAEAKACGVPSEVFHAEPPPVMIAADTIVVLKGRILGKPGNPERAYAMLRSLAGTTHDVVTGCVMYSQGAVLHAFAVQTQVSMWDAPPVLLHTYANSNEPLDKAGAYAAQGAGAALVRGINGSWSNVVGLPLTELVEALLRMNIIAPDGAKVNQDAATSVAKL